MMPYGRVMKVVKGSAGGKTALAARRDAGAVKLLGQMKK
jgi:hypothetical protein